ALHALGVGEEVLAGICEEALLSADAAHAKVDRDARRHVAYDLLADRDGVVGELGLDVQVDGLLVVPGRQIEVAETHTEVAHPVVQPDVGAVVRLELLDGPAVELQRLLPLLALLVPPRLLFESLDTHSLGLEIGVPLMAPASRSAAARTGAGACSPAASIASSSTRSSCDSRADTCSSSRRDNRREALKSRSDNLS